MFKNLFGKKKEQFVGQSDNPSDTVTLASKKLNTDLTIEEIHREFNTASDVALEEANKIIAGLDTLSINKGARLKHLGFRATADVKRSEEQSKIKQELDKMASVVHYYKERYPNYKFISKADVVKICNKYNLVCGSVGNFIGFVPEKNLKQIEEFSSIGIQNRLDADIPYDLYIDSVRYYDGEAHKVRIYMDTIEKNYPVEIRRDQSKSVYNSQAERDLKILAGISGGIRDLDATVRQASGLSICAPIKDFDTSQGTTLKNGFLTTPSKTTHKVVPDPVVLQRVYDGFLIVTAWGEEASDPLVVNEINN